MRIEDGTLFTFDYVLRDGAGRELDRSRLTCVQGEGRLIPGVERACAGRAAGERFELTLAPEQAYGFHDEQLVELVPLSELERAGPAEVGACYQARTEQGLRVTRVLAIEGDEARVDRNHPLAGLELHFAITIVSVRTAPGPPAVG